jgi:hypothetical protein
MSSVNDEHILEIHDPMVVGAQVFSGFEGLPAVGRESVPERHASAMDVETTVLENDADAPPAEAASVEAEFNASGACNEPEEKDCGGTLPVRAQITPLPLIDCACSESLLQDVLSRRLALG